jgi:hypothetical protein
MTFQGVQSRSGMSARAAVLAYIVVSGLVLLLMMLLGLTMRLAQHNGSMSSLISSTSS